MEVRSVVRSIAEGTDTVARAADDMATGSGELAPGRRRRARR